MPATLTQFNEDLSIDHGLMAEHAQWLVENGCSGLVPHGSLGEGASLDLEEKSALQRTYVAAVPNTPVVPGIAGLTTKDCIEQARMAEDNGCSGLMVLPPYQYSSDWREMKTHVASVMAATKLPCMLYNNPVAYKTDFLPEHIAELANESENLVAVKESSTDSRRIAAIRALCGNRLSLGVGVDDCALEGAAMGARFWITGVGGQLPRHNVRLWEMGVANEVAQANDLYAWMLPLLRMDTVVKFVQLLKRLQTFTYPGGRCSDRVRPPRLPLVGGELQQTDRTIRRALERDPLAAK